MAELGFEELRKIQLHEKNYPSLAEVDEGFFSSFKQFLEKQRQRLEGDFSLEAAAAFENAQKLFREISRRRERKIFLKALSDFQAGKVDSAGLSAEEKELYTSLVKTISEHEAGFESLLVQKKQEAEKPVQEDFVEVRLLADLPQFVGSKSTLGPFTASQTARVPRQDARLLIEQGVAQEA